MIIMDSQLATYLSAHSRKGEGEGIEDQSSVLPVGCD